MSVQRDTGLRWLPRSRTGHLVVGAAIFPKLGQWKRSLISSTSVLPTFLTTPKSPEHSVSWGQVHPQVTGFLLSLSLHSTALLDALVMNCICSSLYQYCLVFFLSFFLSGLSCSLPFLLYPISFSPFFLCWTAHSWSWRHTTSRSCQLVSTVPLRTCQRWMGWWWAIRSSATPRRPRRCPR